MSNIISRDDYAKLQNLASLHGTNVKFSYVDKKGKATDVNTNVDSTTVKEGSILTHNDVNGYRRYLFTGLTSDVIVS